MFLPSRPPFTAYNQKELAEKIREGKFRRIPYRYSEELNTLLSRMLHLKVWNMFHSTDNLHIKFRASCEQLLTAALLLRWLFVWITKHVILLDIQFQRQEIWISHSLVLKLTVCFVDLTVVPCCQDYLRPSVESILQSSLLADLVADEQSRAQARHRRRSADPEKPKPAESSTTPTIAALRLKEQVLRHREKALKEREERLERECHLPLSGSGSILFLAQPILEVNVHFN